VVVAGIALDRRRAARGGRYSAALAGLLALLPTWIALVHIDASGRRVPSGPFYSGPEFCCRHRRILRGRQFGRLPLAPRVSPKKTWEGVLGGMLMALGVGAFGAAWFGSAATLRATVSRSGSVSVVGDLTESLLSGM